jgi:hypothetical protein
MVVLAYAVVDALWYKKDSTVEPLLMLRLMHSDAKYDSIV